MKSLFKTVALITIFSFLTRVLGFVFRIILSRTVGAEGLGIYQMAMSVFMVLLTIISSGIPFVLSRETSALYSHKKEKSAGSYISVALIFTLLLSIVICVFVPLLKGVFLAFWTEDGCYKVLVSLLPALVFSSVYCVLRGQLWGKGNYFALCSSELYEQVIRIVLSLLVIKSSFSALENAFNLGWTMSVACFFSMLFVVGQFFLYGGRLYKPQKEFLKPFLKQSSPITLMRIVGAFVQPLIAFIIPARLTLAGYTTSQAIGLYGVAMGMTMPLLFVPSTIIGSLSTALVPDISSAIAQNNQHHIEKRISSSITFSLSISALFVPVFMGVGEQIGLFLFDNILSGSLLQGASWVLIPLGLNGITSSLLNSLGLENKSFKNFVFGGIIMFAILWFTPSFLGINSLIIGMGVNYLICFLLNLRLLQKYIKINLGLAKVIAKILLASVPAGALASFVVALCEYVFPLFFTVAIGCAVAMSSFILLCQVEGLFNMKMAIVFLKEKIKVRKTKKA